MAEKMGWKMRLNPKKIKPKPVKPKLQPYLDLVKQWVKDNNSVTLDELAECRKELGKAATAIYNGNFLKSREAWKDPECGAFSSAYKAVDAAIKAEEDEYYSDHWKYKVAIFVKQSEATICLD
jgi:hypothetical protein